jgi:hypothetical protein
MSEEGNACAGGGGHVSNATQEVRVVALPTRALVRAIAERDQSPSDPAC